MTVIIMSLMMAMNEHTARRREIITQTWSRFCPRASEVPTPLPHFTQQVFSPKTLDPLDLAIKNSQI
uniref:Uncharacterized protein n=1 Tax=Anguilla anguilla TaxID=7936 RepID=A0A0E9VDQ5_ANGAN